MGTALYTITQLGFVATTVVFFGLVIARLKTALSKSHFEPSKQKTILKKVIVALVVWMVFLSAMSISGFFQNFNTIPPRFVIIITPPLLVLVWAIFFSQTTKDLLTIVPPQTILNLQVFRIVVELLLWLLFIQNLLPVQMTFEGWNFDIISGITGPVVAYFGIVKNKWPKSVLLAWNFVCLGLLINIVTIAILSFPTPFRHFMNEPANYIVAQFPFVWLPGFLVPLAYSLHFLSIRQLINQKD